MVSAVRADATEVPMPKHKSSSTNVYPLHGGKLHTNFEKKKIYFSEKKISIYYDQEKYAESIGEIRF